MRSWVLGVCLLLGAASNALAQAEAPALGIEQPAAGARRPARVPTAREAAREAERAAALARGRKRFFEQQIGFDHQGDDPLASGALPPGVSPLPTNILPRHRRF